MRDAQPGDVIRFKFTSISSGVPTALASGAVVSWQNDSTLSSTAGLTLTSTFANVTGLNHVIVQTTADSTFYAAGREFQVALSAGTVDTVSAIGYVVGEFTIAAGTISEIHAESTATAAVVDGIAAGTTMLSTDLDDLIATSTAIAATSTAIAAGTTMLSTDLDDLIATSTAIAATSTAIAAGTTMLSTDMDDLIASTTSIEGTIGAAGAGLSAVPWNAAWDAEVESEVNDAMVALNLDHLILDAGTADAGSTLGITLPSGAPSDDDALVGAVIWTTGGSGAGQMRTIKSYTGSTRVALVDPVFETAADATTTFVITAGRGSAWDEATTAHIAAGTFGFHIQQTVAKEATVNAVGVIVTNIESGTTMLSTDMDDLIATSTAIAATSTAIAAGTTMLSTDLDDLIATSTAIAATSTAIQAGTTMLSTDLDDLIATSTAIAATSTAIAAGTTMLSTDLDDLIATTTGIAAGTTTLSTDLDDLIATSTAIAATSTAIAAGTTMLSTDLDDLIASTTAILDDTGVSGVKIGTNAVDAAALSTDAVDEIWTKIATELSTAMNATPTMADILSFQHMAGWNKHVTTASSGYDLIYNDAGVQAFQASITQPTTDSFERAQFTT